MRAEMLACAANACDTAGAKADKKQTPSINHTTQGRRVADRYREWRIT